MPFCIPHAMSLKPQAATVTQVKEGAVSAQDVELLSHPAHSQLYPRLVSAQQMSKADLRLAGKRVRRKVDIRLLGMAWLMLMFNYFDRCIIAAARVVGIQKSLHMNSTQYGTAVGILYVGYVLMQVPSNLILTKLRPSIYLPSCMAIWGVISACSGLVHSAWSLHLVRFLLGFVEAPFTVGALFLVSSWYTRSELGVRSAMLLSAPLLGNAVSGLIAAGITDALEGAGGFEAWRWMFIIGGGSTILISILAFFSLPDFPSNTRWLSCEERAVAEWILILDAGQVDEEATDWKHGVNTARKDLRVYGFAAMYMLLSVASSLHNFFPSVVQTLGFRRMDTLLLTAPPYLVAILVAIYNNWSADRTRNSSFHVAWPLAAAIIGFSICAATLSTWARYVAMILMVAGGHGANAVVLAWAQKTMIRPRIKRACALAFINATGTLAQILTSFMYPSRTAPRYVIAMSVNSATALGAISLAFTMRVILQRANKKLDADSNVEEAMSSEASFAIEGIPEDERQAARRSFRYVT
ncbi:MFS-type transporter efuF [Exophiala dermatitidis]|uniref:Retrograde regulation protein 2 n=1 Tax=Exophiala dermatitidis (strain ATCC 34100 / CBS 525.76 / NIH/UT8656) TaxID=858893 RepID=H6BV89_EXODN|nr:retrograde regulation protein 2 [Exophiala dermatitidis NIH/UT8656]EHY55003.1 retrograde regulation protein 2 [Exophiala dermatitidis NIH/UT8656]